MEELIEETLNTDAHYQTLNASLRTMYQARRDLISLFNITNNETASQTLDAAVVCLSDDANASADTDCEGLLSNVIHDAQNFSAQYGGLSDESIFRLERFLEGETQDKCAESLRNTSQLFYQFTEFIDWASLLEAYIPLALYGGPNGTTEGSGAGVFSAEQLLTHVFTLLRTFPVQDSSDIVSGVMDACAVLNDKLKTLEAQALAAMETISGVRDAQARVDPLLRRWVNHVIFHYDVPTLNHTNPFPVEHVIKQYQDGNITKLELAKHFESESFSQQMAQFISNSSDMEAVMTSYRDSLHVMRDSLYSSYRELQLFSPPIITEENAQRLELVRRARGVHAPGMDFPTWADEGNLRRIIANIPEAIEKVKIAALQLDKLYRCKIINNWWATIDTFAYDQFNYH